jgi:hypothetical protein
MEQQNWALQFTGATQLSVSGLQDSRIVRPVPGGEAGLILRAASADFVRSTFYDRAVMAGLFYVISDETNAFENDTFRFAQEAVGEPTGPDPTTLVPPPAVVALFKALEGSSVLISIGGLGDALDDDTVGFVGQALKSPDPIEDDSSYLTIKVNDVGGTESLSVSDGFAAFLFAPGSQNPTGPTRHLLVITAEVSVWETAAYSLYHTRNNQAQAPNAPNFNPQLWQFSPIVGDDVPVEVHASRTADSSVVIPGDSRAVTPIQAVLALLVNNGHNWLQDAQDGQGWKGTDLDLSILVSAIHQVSIPTLVTDGSAPQSPSVVSHGQLPLCNALATGQSGMNGDQVSFDGSRKYFAVDFTWTNRTSTEVLRIATVKVQF